MSVPKKWMAGLLALSLGMAGLGTAALAAGGDESDPLVTLSYLTQTFQPSLLKEVETATAAKETALKEQLQQVTEQYKKDMEALLQGGGGGADSAAYTVVTMASGQTMQLEVGCEVMLRIGTATLTAGSSPGLVDATTGGSLGNGGSLETNHLYLATIQDRSLKATADTVKLLVRGGYTLG